MPARPRILVVDDDETVCEAIRQLLEKEGYDVYVAHDAVAGVKLAVKHNPALILLDLRMPVGGEEEDLKPLTSDEGLRKTPVIVITSLRPEDLPQHIPSQGAPREVLHKPLDLDALLQAVFRLAPHAGSDAPPWLASPAPSPLAPPPVTARRPTTSSRRTSGPPPAPAAFQDLLELGYVPKDQLAPLSARATAFSADVALFASYHALALTVLFPSVPLPVNPHAGASFLFWAVAFAAYATLLSSGGRRTLGKWLVGISVVDTRGRPLTLLSSALRSVGYAASCLLGLGFAWSLFHPERRCWHDSLADSVVVMDRPFSGLKRSLLALAACLSVCAFVAAWLGLSAWRRAIVPGAP